jgi:hypothetical protein
VGGGRRRWLARGAGALGLLALAGSSTLATFAPPALASASSGGPRLYVRPRVGRVGSFVAVVAKGLPPRVDVSFQICGDDGLMGSAGCNLDASQMSSDNQFGRAHATVLLARPPVPCPCVVEAVSTSLANPIEAPVRILGVPVAPLRRIKVANPYRRLRVTGASIGGDGPWQAWFGAAPQRTLVLTLVNGSGTRLLMGSLILTLSPAGAAAIDVAAPELPPMPPHSRRTYRIEVGFPSFATGSFRLKGFLAGSPATTFRLVTSMYPIGLFVALAVLLALVAVFLVLGTRLALRGRRLTRHLKEAMRVSLPLAPEEGSAKRPGVAPDRVAAPAATPAGHGERGGAGEVAGAAAESPPAAAPPG